MITLNKYFFSFNISSLFYSHLLILSIFPKKSSISTILRIVTLLKSYPYSYTKKENSFRKIFNETPSNQQKLNVLERQRDRHCRKMAVRLHHFRRSRESFTGAKHSERQIQWILTTDSFFRKMAEGRARKAGENRYPIDSSS